MPGYKVHTAGGLCLAVVFMFFVVFLGVLHFDMLTMLLIAAVLVVSSLVPDIDTDSKGQNLVYGLLIIVDLILILKECYKAAAFLGFIALLPALGHHRGWTHSWWAVFFMPAPLILIPLITQYPSWQGFVPFYLAAVIGYGSHLILDKLF